MPRPSAFSAEAEDEENSPLRIEPIFQTLSLSLPHADRCHKWGADLPVPSQISLHCSAELWYTLAVRKSAKS